MKLKMLFILVLLLAASAIWYFTPKHYNKTLDGVYYQLGQEGIIGDVKVHLSGKLRNHINGHKSFRGTIDITGAKVPQIPKGRDDLQLLYSGENFASVVSFYSVSGKNGTIVPNIYFYGAAYINDDFTRFTIALSNDENKHWTQSDGFMITAPAKDREEATRISQELMSKFGTRIN
ncbi:hypothetical protein [Paenibacillus albus]|uniref:Uncharacterized protein n=1 Tax=Paenibacillus albus TaxID=2495582 RepID=A0A3S8ZXT6_9BACL|nr:hypothetical protein [Paenibacillus albus]AZN38320.1 hypothetical protein EJC50_00480 [Paenibacillus albus]